MKPGRTPRQQEDRPPRRASTCLFPSGWVFGLVALLLRVLLLDRAPLPSSEATYSFAAWQASRGQLDGSLVDTGAPLLPIHHAALLSPRAQRCRGAHRVRAGWHRARPDTRAVVGHARVAGGVLRRCTRCALADRDPAGPGRRPASLSALLSMVVVASTVRLLTDRPGGPSGCWR